MTRETAGWHAEKIKAELRIRYGSLKAFAESRKIAPSSLSDAITNPMASARVELIVADALGISPFDLWPDRWTEDGRKISRAELVRVLKTEQAPGAEARQ